MKKGLTLIELLVAMAISLVILGSVYAFYQSSLNISSKERKKAQTLKEVREAFRILEDDIRQAGFGFPKTGCNGKGICYFYVDNNCNVGDETFCKAGTDRFFVADGWQIIKDFTDDGNPDGNIKDKSYEKIIKNKYCANVTSYTLGAKQIQVNKVDIDKPDELRTTNDIKCKKAIIVCYNGTVEGRRIEKANPTTKIIKLNRLEQPLSTSKGIVLPANVWYVRENSGTYWLYRNEKRVLPNVEGFQVHVGYDSDGNGIVNGTEGNTTSLPPDADPKKLKFFRFDIIVSYKWKGKEYSLNSTMRTEAFH